MDWIVGLFILAFIVGASVLTYWCHDNDKMVGTGLSIAAIILLSLSFITVPFSIHKIDAGKVAVVKHLGKATGVREAGTHFDWWFVNSYTVYDGRVQNLEIKTMTYSSDAQTMDIEMTVQYSIMPEKVMDICNHYGNLKALEGRITSIATEKAKAVLSAHKAMDIIAQRSDMSPYVEEAIQNAIGDEYYVNINTVVLTNIDFSDAFESAVEEKMIAEQKQLKADYENQTKIATAKAEAEATLAKAEAEAAANEMLARSMTDAIIKAKFYEKWDGKLPEVMGEGTVITNVANN